MGAFTLFIGFATFVIGVFSGFLLGAMLSSSKDSNYTNDNELEEI